MELPIYYCEQKKEISDGMCKDLELIEGNDEENKPIYEYIFRPSMDISRKFSKKWHKFYTTDTGFLLDSQEFFKKMKHEKIDKENIENAFVDWKEIKDNAEFLEIYKYIEWDKIKFLNKSLVFITLLSYYNMFSPIINLLIPIIILFLPFFILKLMKLPINFDMYKKILFKQLKNHILGRMFTEFRKVKWDKKVYMVFSLIMYVLNIYQNIVSCYKFYKNMYKINDYIGNMKRYLSYSMDKMDMVISFTENLKTYQTWTTKLRECRDVLNNLHNKLALINNTAISLKKMMQLGYVMQQFYSLYDSEEINEAINFSFDFNSYVDNIVGLNKNIKEKFINYSKFTNKYNSVIKKCYYPPLMDEKPVKNNIVIKNNKIITGPNAAGKTTIIKATILNILFSQQIGCGFFSSAKMHPYHNLHCYLNIPDTSGRDSLFQAEARRCKEILTTIDQNPKERHFCIFDELYSGTNPYEAIGSAYSFLLHISKNKNVNFMLTTHYIKLCTLIEKQNNIVNYNMETMIKNNIPTYSYNLVKGISEIKGGVCVLKQLRYPRNIIRLTNKIMRQL
ncbi:hypothetical protein [uncultured Mediterranean phage]|nr:hypothetical protein [uncultured Mediterranean phage]